MVSVESDNDREGSRLTKTDLLRPSLANQPTEHNSIPFSLSLSLVLLSSPLPSYHTKLAIDKFRSVIARPIRKG